MKTQLPAHTRLQCPCPIIEIAFARLESLCPFPEELVDEARELTKCANSGTLQRRRAESFVSAAINVLCQAELGDTGFKRLAALRGTTAFAHMLLSQGRNREATAVALEVLAESVPLRHGTEDGQRAIWREIIERVGVMRRVE